MKSVIMMSLLSPMCRQVPGISSDMYFFTLATSIAGGLVVGFVDKLEPQGEVGIAMRGSLHGQPAWVHELRRPSGLGSKGCTGCTARNEDRANIAS